MAASSTATYYPPGAFSFDVQVLGSGSTASVLTGADASFQEVLGIQGEFTTEDVAEGGENRFVYRLPQRAKYANLTLKRGAVTADSYLALWAGQTLAAGLAVPVTTQNVLVVLMNEKHLPTLAWSFLNAYPVKWEMSPLNAMENKILTETLELAYGYFEQVNLGSGANESTLRKMAARLSSASA